MVVTAALTPLIPLYAVARGASPAIVGVVAASAAVLPLAFGVWTGVAADVVGSRRMSVGAAVVLAASGMLIAAAPTITLLIVGTAIAGLASNALILANQTSVAQISRPENRDRNFGYFAFSVSIGQLMGPMAGGFLADAYSIQTALYLFAVLSLVPGVLALRLPPSPNSKAHAETGPQGLRAEHAYRAAWGLARRQELRFVLSIAFVIIFAWSIKSSFYPLYLQSVGISKSSIGLIFSFLGAGSMIVRPLVGIAAGQYGRRQVLLGAVVLAAVAIGATPFLTRFWPLALAATVTGMAWGFTQPLTMSLMAGNVAFHERGLALSLRMTSNRLAEVISPMVFGTLVVWAGLRSAFFLSAAALGVGIWVISRATAETGARGVTYETGEPSGIETHRAARAHPSPANGVTQAQPSPVPPDRG